MAIGNLSVYDDSIFSSNDYDLYVLMDRAKSTISRSCDLEIAAYGITQEQAAILDTLMRAHGSATIAEIVEATVRQTNSVTTLINRMVKNGLIEKERPSKSGKYIITMTEKGKSTYAKLTRNAIEMAFSDLSEEEKLMLFLVLKKLMKKGRAMLGIDFKMPFLPS